MLWCRFELRINFSKIQPLSVRVAVRPSVRPSFLCFITLYCMNGFPYKVFGISRRCVARAIEIRPYLRGQGHTGGLDVKMHPFVSGL